MTRPKLPVLAEAEGVVTVDLRGTARSAIHGVTQDGRPVYMLLPHAVRGSSGHGADVRRYGHTLIAEAETMDRAGPGESVSVAHAAGERVGL